MNFHKPVVQKEIAVISSLYKTRDINLTAQFLELKYHTVIQILKRLEDKLNGNQKIFLRSAGSKLEPNPIFYNFISDCVKISSIEENFYKPLLPSDRVILRTSSTIYKAFISPYVKSLIEEYNISFLEDDKFLADKPIANEICMTIKKRPDTSSYIYFHFHDFTQFLWASAQYIQENGPFEKESDLDGKNILIQRTSLDASERGGSTLEIVEYRGMISDLKKQGIKLNLLDVEGTNTVDTFVEHGAGIMIASAETTTLMSLKVKKILPHIHGSSIPIYIKARREAFEELPSIKEIVDKIMGMRDKGLSKILSKA